MSGRRGIPFVVSAPSGTGKTTVCRAVVKRDPQIRFSVSHTTRPPRPGERNGVHYFFVSQTAHLLALFPVFLAVGISAGVPGVLMAYMLLMASNFFSVITPQASSGNVIFVGSGYITTREVYRYGGIVTLANLVVYGIVGPLWILAVF